MSNDHILSEETDLTPQNHVHIPGLVEGGNVTIDGVPIKVISGGVELNGVGNRDEVTTVTLTILPAKITVGGDV